MSARPAASPPAGGAKRAVKKSLLILFTLLPPLILLLLRPFGMDGRQSAILAALILTILWWVSGAVERTAASVFLLAVFFLFSGAPAATVFTFPRSENFLMILFSFLFSQGISNSGLADRLLQPLLGRAARSIPRLLLSMVCCSLAMIFVIPQPFSRIIILSAIYSSFFDRLPCVLERRSLKPVLMLGLFLSAVLADMLLLRGDIILNGALVSMGGVAMDEGTWIRYMFVPTAVLLLLALVLFALVFRRELRGYRCSPADLPSAPKAPLTRREKGCLVFIVCIVVLWATEDLHGISGTLTVIAGTALMFLPGLGLLGLHDLKSVNLKLLVFLTAAFAIGGVLKSCGVADILFSRFMFLFPETFSLGYIAVVLLTCIVLHMVLGSNVTTMSVVVPGLMTIGAGVAPPLVLLFLIYIAICGHFILPFHHVMLLLGEGKGYYGTSHMVRLGIPLTVLILLCAILVYMGWWQLLGFL